MEVIRMLVKLNAQKLKAFRKERKLTQECLAERANASCRYIQALEHGENDNPSASLVCRVSLALDVRMEELMAIMEEDEGSSVN